MLLVLTRCLKIGAVLSADVFARYSRLRGGEEFFFFLVNLFQLCCLKDGTLCSFAELTSTELRQKCSRESEVSHPEKFATSFTRFFLWFVRLFCCSQDFVAKIHTQVYDWFGISFDFWGRTPTQQHTEITQGCFLSFFSSFLTCV